MFEARSKPPTKVDGPQSLNGYVTFLVPFAGNRMNAPMGGPIHILQREELKGSLTWCGLTVTTARTKYNQRDRLKKAEEPQLHDACLRNYLAR